MIDRMYHLDFFYCTQIQFMSTWFVPISKFKALFSFWFQLFLGHFFELASLFSNIISLVNLLGQNEKIYLNPKKIEIKN